MATASVTLSWSAGIVATVRYYQLAAPTASTPAVPTSASKPGSWSETEPAADVTKVLWTCERTVYADGTESWSKASRSTSYEAAKDAASKAQTALENARSALGRNALCTSDTAAGTAAKVATVASGDFSLSKGSSVTVVFANANTAASPTLDVGGTGARPVMTNGTPYAYWAAGSAVTLVYDGTTWQVCSVPVYASTVTVGNPGGANVLLDSDSMDVRRGSDVLASFGADTVEIGRGSDTSTLYLVDRHGRIFGYADPSMGDTGITELRMTSDKFLTLVGSEAASLEATWAGVDSEFSSQARLDATARVDEDGTYAANVDIVADAVDGTDSGRATRSTITMVARDGATLNGAHVPAATVLFDNPGVAINVPITISRPASEFDALVIEYQTNDGFWGSTTVAHPDGKVVCLQTDRMVRRKDGSQLYTAVWITYKAVIIQGTTINTFSEKDPNGSTYYITGQWNGRNTWREGDYMGIKRVVGIKY